MQNKRLYNTPKRPSMAVQGGIAGYAGRLQPLNTPNADLSTAVSVGQSMVIALYNSATTTQFYNTGIDNTVLATNFTNAMPIPPLSYLYINTCSDSYIITTAGVYGFWSYDEVQYTNNNDQPNQSLNV
jgi:hypothetical protein